MWWVPLTWIGVPQHIVLHTVFEVDQTPEGYIYTHQEVSRLKAAQQD